MMATRAPYLACVVGVLLAGSRAEGSEVGRKPSIEEMLSAVSDVKAGADRTVPGPAEARPADQKPLPQAPTDYAAAETKKLEKRAVWLYPTLRKNRFKWEIVQLYIRLERFKEAATALAPMLRSRDSGPNQSRARMDHLGMFELEYARIMICLGQEKTAASMMDQHKGKLKAAKASSTGYVYVTYWAMKGLEAQYSFLQGLPNAMTEVEALRDALAQEPNGDVQWQLVQICDPNERKAVLGMTWITAILDMIARYPNHKAVTSGEAHMHLQRAYRYHLMFDEALALLESYPKDFPESQYTRRNDSVWEIPAAYAEKGDFCKMIRLQQEAGEGWRTALELYSRFKDEFPNDPRCQRKKEKEWPAVDNQIRSLESRLRRGN